MSAATLRSVPRVDDSAERRRLIDAVASAIATYRREPIDRDEAERLLRPVLRDRPSAQTIDVQSLIG
jgi:hypothetical protein